MKYTLSVSFSGSTQKIEYTPSKRYSLKDILFDNGIVIRSDCGGNSLCGKCKVYVDDPDVLEGAVNSCCYYPDKDLCVRIPDESLFDIDVANTSLEPSHDWSAKHADYPTGGLGAAIDLGSTTISISLLYINEDSSYDKALEIDSYSCFNPTLIYGSDIVSRQHSSIEGHKEDIKKLLADSLKSALEKIASKNKVPHNALKRIYISGNTTMQYFLLGLECNDIAVYPFSAEHLTYKSYASKTTGTSHGSADISCKSYKTNICDDSSDITLLPSFSTFIGADIISGLYYINAADIREPFLFLDLGTNAEMAIGYEGRIVCTSAAAGPAFEGTNISCGCAAIPGAINKVSIKRRLSYETIDNKNPVGICGSGILSLYSELLNNNILDETKTFSDEYIENGFMVAATPNGFLTITQKDIRELQLAIAAIRTGIQILFNKTGITSQKLKSIYISGSLGKALDPDIFERIGLIPGADSKTYKKIILAGNTSLEGAKKALSDPDHEKSMNHIMSLCSEVILAKEPTFNDIFLSNI